ncbi:MAG: 30S ribosomal protein S12 methylthiotransferase RimO [bacterium]
MPSLHFISLGCPKNLVDSEVMLGLLVKDGFVLTEDPSAAEVIVVNTCAFIEDAKKEAIETVLEMSQQKKRGRCRLLVVAGCLPQRYSEEIAELFPEVDLFVGAGEFHRVAELVKGLDGGQRVQVGRPSYIYDHEAPRVAATPPHMAYIKIAEGCFHPCSFCIIPRIRGKFRSRTPDSIVEEAREMLSRGVRELNIIAQDTTAYGRDIGADLAELLGRLCSLQGRKWIRMLYAYPHDFPLAVIEAMKMHGEICRYLDIPIQHISDRVLAAMRRKGEGAEIRRLIGLMRKELPGVALRTSLIAGFPGETDDDFSALLDFVRESEFEHLGVFVYSPEEGTPAARLRGRIRAEVAEERRQRIMELQRAISQRKNQALVGRRLTALVEGPSQETEHLIQARHEGQAPDIDGVIYINEGLAPAGEFATVEITEAHEYDLVGKIIDKPTPCQSTR